MTWDTRSLSSEAQQKALSIQAKLHHFTLGDDGADVAVEKVDDLARRAGRGHQRIPAVDDGIDAELAHGRHIRQLR